MGSEERSGGARRRAPRPPGARRRTRRRRGTWARRRRIAGALALVALVAGVAALAASGGGSRAPRKPAARTPGASARHEREASSSQTASASRGAQAGRESQGDSARIRRLTALGRPIYCAAPRGNEVALTFDDGPGPYTRLVLAKLRKHGVRASFFVVGRNIPLVRGADGSSIVREERALGVVGDHTFTHPLLTALAPAGAEAEIVSTQAALARASGGPVFLFRPPYGAHDASIDAIARAHNLLEILWTVDSADSLGASYAQIESTVIAGLRPGAIILMHENHGQTVRALINIFAALKRKRLRAVSVSQLLSDHPPSAALLRAGGRGCGLSRGASNGG